jgi:ElaB/YqjD/DUF883 family membrane-anchored ribosome-binding protein
MRVLLLALALVGPASAEAPGPSDTVTFTRAEIQQLEDDLEQMVRQREAAAFQAGQKDARERCRSLL